MRGANVGQRSCETYLVSSMENCLLKPGISSRAKKQTLNTRESFTSQSLHEQKTISQNKEGSCATHASTIHNTLHNHNTNFSVKRAKRNTTKKSGQRTNQTHNSSTTLTSSSSSSCAPGTGYGWAGVSSYRRCAGS